MSSTILYNYFNDSYIPSEETGDPDIQEKDMLNCCLPGGFFNCPYASWPVINRCVGFMSTKCAGNWDGTCDLYLGNLQKEEGINFLNETFKRKYCLASRSKSSLGCGVECSQFNPNDPDSPNICFQKGMKGVYRNENNSNNDGLEAFDKYTRNSNLDPLDLIPCDKDVKCDITNADPSDPLIQRCLTWGACDMGGNIIDNNSSIQSLNQQKRNRLENYQSSSKCNGMNLLIIILLIVIAIVGIKCWNDNKKS